MEADEKVNTVFEASDTGRPFLYAENETHQLLGMFSSSSGTAVYLSVDGMGLNWLVFFWVLTQAIFLRKNWGYL